MMEGHSKCRWQQFNGSKWKEGWRVAVDWGIEGWRRKLIIDADEDKDPEGQFCNFSSSVSTGVGLSLSASFDRVMSIADGVGFWSELVELAVADFWPELMELDL